MMFKYSRSALVIIAISLCSWERLVASPYYAAVEFDKDFLWGSDQEKYNIDLSRFAKGNAILPGNHQVQLYVNDFFHREMTVSFRELDNNASKDVVPCFTPEQMLSMGLDLEKLDFEKVVWLTGKVAVKPGDCKSISTLVPSSLARYDFSEQRLDVSIPQAYQHNRPKDYIDPALWDRGVTAARMNYSLNLFQSEFSGKQDSQGFLQLESGFNHAGWRFRQVSTLNKNEYEQTYQAQRTYAQTDIAGLRSTLTIGETYSDGQIFDSFGIRGLLLSTDDRMLPASQRGYAPVIQGVANSNAKVSVSQAGIVLYQKTVPPGPFEIKDLNPIGYGSDLEVTVTEADGQSKIFTVPYSAAAQLLRPGDIRVSSGVGQAWSAYRDHYNPLIGQFTVQYGLNNELTPYGGFLMSEDYLSLAMGSAISTAVGGLAMDYTYATNRLDNSTATNGGSLRLIYSTFVDLTNTNITLASYRYSSRGYWSFSDVLQTEDRHLAGYSDAYAQRNIYSHQKSRFDVNLRQSLGPGWGYIYLSGAARNYWNRSGSDTDYRLTYSNNFRDLSFDISASRSLTQNGQRSNEVRASFTLPLSLFGSTDRQYLSGRAWDSSDGSSQGQLSLSGNAGRDQEYNYTVTTSHPLDGANTGASHGVSGSYQGPYANVTGGVDDGDDYRQLSLGISGGVIAHAEGITLGQTLGETVALVKAKDAGGARINNAFGASVDSRGFGVVPYMSAYSRNRIELDPNGLSADLQLESASSEVIPAAGAVVTVNFATSKQNSVLISAHFPDGSPLPFGSEVRDQESASTVGFVGQGGSMFVRGVQSKGILRVSLAQGRHCTLAYSVAEQSEAGDLQKADADSICQPTISE